MSAEQRTAYLGELEQRFGVPCFDPIASGADTLVDHLLRVCPPVSA
jgi:uncharacterized NAD-dependent epimerase/dehydratase family protein